MLIYTEGSINCAYVVKDCLSFGTRAMASVPLGVARVTRPEAKAVELVAAVGGKDRVEDFGGDGVGITNRNE